MARLIIIRRRTDRLIRALSRWPTTNNGLIVSGNVLHRRSVSLLFQTVILRYISFAFNSLSHPDGEPIYDRQQRVFTTCPGRGHSSARGPFLLRVIRHGTVCHSQSINQSINVYLRAGFYNKKFSAFWTILCVKIHLGVCMFCRRVLKKICYA